MNFSLQSRKSSHLLNCLLDFFLKFIVVDKSLLFLFQVIIRITTWEIEAFKLFSHAVVSSITQSWRIKGLVRWFLRLALSKWKFVTSFVKWVGYGFIVKFWAHHKLGLIKAILVLLIIISSIKRIELLLCRIPGQLKSWAFGVEQGNISHQPFGKLIDFKFTVVFGTITTDPQSFCQK